MKLHSSMPAHLQREYVPQAEGPAIRILEWFAQQPAGIQVKTADLERDPGCIMRSGMQVRGQLKATLDRALVAQYLTFKDGTYSRGPRWCVYAAVSAARNAQPHPLYSPPQHSWGRVVCEFFRANPEEELTLDDITEKFRNPHVRPPMSPEREDWFLGRVRREGYLRRAADTYSAGPNINKLPTLFRSVGASTPTKE